MQSEENDADWNQPVRIAFRFAFTYLVLYNLPIPFLWEFLVPWVGARVLHLNYEITVFPNGSGDTTFNYVQVFCFLALALGITLVWTMLDRKRRAYPRMHQWLRLCVRMVLALTLISYGSAKITPSQMPAPSLTQLSETYGGSSPMRLLWTFIGASRPYEAFSGFAEMLAGMLLFVPRLTTLGALLSIGVMTNVFVLNMSYDVPVKLYSFHLLLMSLFLAAPDLGQLVNVFVLGRSGKISANAPLFRKQIPNRLLLAFQILIGVLAVTGALTSVLLRSPGTAHKIGPPLQGVWTVEQYAVDGEPRPPLLTDRQRWRRIAFDEQGTFGIQPMDGPSRSFQIELNAGTHSFTLNKYGNKATAGNFSYESAQPGLIALEGRLDNLKISATLRRQEDFLLTTRGFHWINEYPFNASQEEGSTSRAQSFGVATATFPVAVAAGKRIQYSGYIRTEDVTDGWAGLWWRVDGENKEVLAFDNMEDRAATGITAWTRYEIAMEVPPGAKNINFGVLHPGNGAAWFDSLKIQIDDQPYLDSSSFDLDFESAATRGFFTGGAGYDVKQDPVIAHSGRQSLRISAIK